MKYFCILVSFILISCGSDKIEGLWFVVDDVEEEYQAHYRSLYEFTSDSLIIDFLGAGRKSFEIISKSATIIKTDSFPELGYSYLQDTLILQLPNTKLKLLRFEFSNVSIDSLNEKLEILNNSKWSYRFNETRIESILLGEAFTRNAKHAAINVFNNERFQRSLEDPAWSLEYRNGTYVLMIESPFEDYYPNVFFLKNLEKDVMVAETFRDGVKTDVAFLREEFMGSVEIAFRQKQLLGTWKLIKAILPESEPIDENDTTIISLGPLIIDEPIKRNAVFETHDINNMDLFYDFNRDSTFSLYTSGKEIGNGERQLRKDGGVIKFITYTNINMWNEVYQVQVNDLYIRKLNKDTMWVEQTIHVFESDSIIPEIDYDLILVKMNE